jgi:hypothetical protein
METGHATRICEMEESRRSSERDRLASYFLWTHSKRPKTAMDQHYQEEGAHDRRTNGEQWARKLIHTIWDTMLALWGERNKILNKRDDDIARAHQKEATEQRVRRCYAYKDNL